MLVPILREFTTKEPRRAAIIAAISSSLGNESCFNGATQDFEITSDEWLPH